MDTFSSFIICLVLCISSTHLINVKIVKDSSTSTRNQDLVHNLKSKTKASKFSGPKQLLYLVGKCFSHFSDKYEYSVCPFDNITQREIVWHSNAYNGIIGVWKEWTLNNNSFDSLVFTDGDECEDGSHRNGKLVWVCPLHINHSNDKVLEVNEPKKCFYEILFANDFGCEDKYIYPHLTDDLKHKWDIIETHYFYKELTDLGYESELKQLFVEASIIANKTDIDINFETKDQCLREFILLKEENLKLKQRIEFFDTNKVIKN